MFESQGFMAASQALNTQSQTNLNHLEWDARAPQSAFDAKFLNSPEGRVYMNAMKVRGVFNPFGGK